jgi:RNA polymerase sigma-70 factor (sigma-E family)
MPPTFEEFVADRIDPLLRYATALTCDPHLAKDVVQDVLIRAQRRWPMIGSTDQPAAYVKRMIVNEYLSWRRRRVNRDVSLAHPALVELGSTVDDPTRRYDEREAMLARVVRLPRRQRAVIVLRYYENLTDAEIAAVLGCAEATVRSHASQALAKLRGQTEPAKGVTLPGKGLDHAV